MARGGARPGAGRKPGVPNKRKSVRSSRLLLKGETPLDVMLASMRALLKAKDYAAAAIAAARAAPYVHQRFSATQEPAAKHPSQKLQGDLFEHLPPPGDAEQPDGWDGVLQ